MKSRVERSGLEADGVPEGGNGSPEIPLMAQRDAQVVIGFGESRVEAESMSQGLCGAREILFLKQRDP